MSSPMEVAGVLSGSRTGSPNYMVIEKDNSCLGELQLEGRLWSFLIVPNSLYGNSVDSCAVSACGCARPFRPHKHAGKQRELHFLNCSSPVRCVHCALYGCSTQHFACYPSQSPRHNGPSQCPLCVYSKQAGARSEESKGTHFHAAFIKRKSIAAKIISESSHWSGLRSIGV